jgi:hypothetical protein
MRTRKGQNHEMLPLGPSARSSQQILFSNPQLAFWQLTFPFRDACTANTRGHNLFL